MSHNRTPIDGAVALVTGGHRGFGRAMVDELLDRGAAKVYATSRSPQPQTDGRIVPLVLDVTDDDSVAAAARAAARRVDRGQQRRHNLRTPVLEAPLDEIRAELETNLFGTIRVTRAFAPILARNPSSSLVNVLSVLSWLAFGPATDLKGSSVVGHQLDAVQLRDQGTTVTALYVAYMDTDMTAKLDVPKADPRDIARETADAILTGEDEVLADQTTRAVKSALSKDLSTLYGAEQLRKLAQNAA